MVGHLERARPTVCIQMLVGDSRGALCVVYKSQIPKLEDWLKERN